VYFATALRRDAVTLLLACVAVFTAHAQDYPLKPVRFVSSAVGGPVDGVGRFLANGLTERLKQQVIADGRSGANGIIGTDIVAKSNPDGYTLLMTTGSFAINPGIYKKLPYDTLRDFAPVTLAATSGGLVLVAHPSVTPRSVKELIEFDRVRPGELTFGSGGIGNTLHMAGELFNIQRLGAGADRCVGRPHRADVSEYGDCNAACQIGALACSWLYGNDALKSAA
jgi:tripartite-type tricarboxylate transporter receptor subunit TctC